MLRLIKPEYFMPMHGEYRMLKEHKRIAEDCNIPSENIFICKMVMLLILNKRRCN